jgi:hypothetical protein
MTPANGVLAPAACATYSASYFPTSLAGTNGTATDTVTATATAAITGQAVTGPGNSASANCDLCPLGTGGAPN